MFLTKAFGWFAIDLAAIIGYFYVCKSVLFILGGAR